MFGYEIDIRLPVGHPKKMTEPDKLIHAGIAVILTGWCGTDPPTVFTSTAPAQVKVFSDIRDSQDRYIHREWRCQPPCDDYPEEAKKWVNSFLPAQDVELIIQSQHANVGDIAGCQ